MRLAILGSSFNPPGLHHRHTAEMLSQHFDKILVVPSVPEPGQALDGGVPPIYRAAMVDMTFRNLSKVSVEFFDLEQATSTDYPDLTAKYEEGNEVWHVVPVRLIHGGGEQQSQIHRFWPRGADIWNHCKFAILCGPKDSWKSSDLPPQSKVFQTPSDITSEMIRDRVYHGHDLDELVTEDVSNYIRRHGLFRGTPHSRTTRFTLERCRPMIVADPWNQKATERAKGFPPSDTETPNLIIVLGGDGTMLRAIREHWRRRVPFYGINTGHLGFLLNSEASPSMFDQQLILEQLALLWVETVGPDGEKKSSLAFNEAWVERATGQTAWIRVSVNGRERIPKLVADGILVATAGGSTSYARAMGATPLPLSTPAMVLVGSNVLTPTYWKPVLLSLDSLIEFATLDPDKRPLQGFIDGQPQGIVHSMRIRVSRVAAVELAFDSYHDPAEKLARIQFPAIDSI